VLRGIDPVRALDAWQRRLGFVAPELRAGGEPSVASDAWSVAAIAAAMIAGEGGADDALRVVARRHPPLHDLLQGVIAAPPDARATDLVKLAATARERAAMPYLADDRTGPMRAIRLPANTPPPAAKPLRSKAPTAKVGSGLVLAAHDEPTLIDPSQRLGPETFALPTPAGAAPAPVPQPPAVVIAPRPPSPVPDHTPPLEPVSAAASARVPRARTAPPVGGFQVVSMKPKDPVRPPSDDAAVAPATGKQGSGRVKKAKLRGIAEASKRTFSVEPGALGYLAPPRDVTEARAKAARRRRIQAVILAIVLVAAALGGYLIATRM